ncbi:MAG: hypothetical protein NVS9B2_30490 [Steroidobacteraceae bacterium]
MNLKPASISEPRHHFAERLLRLPEVIDTVGLARATIYEKVKAGEFPAPLQLSECAVAWRLSEIIAWIESRPVAALGRRMNKGVKR